MARVTIGIGILILILMAATTWLHPNSTLTTPYAFASFFQFQMVLYLRDYRQSPPPAYTLFTWFAFAGMAFVFGFPVWIWLRFGAMTAAAMWITGTIVVIIWTVVIRVMAPKRPNDLEMLLNFAGLAGMPIAAVVAISRALSIAAAG